MKPVILSLFSDKPPVHQLQKLLGADYMDVSSRSFPDGETYLQIQGDTQAEIEKNIQGRDIIIFDSLNDPNLKTLPLIFLSDTLRELKAKRVGLVCPYLAYMRQDKRFNPGEAITSTYFAKLLSQAFDWLITVDPHLHRRSSLNEIYSIPNQVLHANTVIAQWVSKNVEKPFFIGPDSESEQWVKNIANLTSAPFVILEKVRHGDRDVTIQFPDLSAYGEHTPVLVDDIISTAKTMMETIRHMTQHHMTPPLCIGVHGLFAQDAYETLMKTGVSQIITCNTISHPTNAIDLIPTLATAIKTMLNGSR